ncbi:MAG: diacylglycerol kinase family protein [Alteraurantiacibacter sp.]
MGEERRIWLVNNAESGSNTAEALEECIAHLGRCGISVAHRTVFPAQELPTPALLDCAGIETVAVFAGDGTVNALLGALRDWSGAILILPGGTMNLLYHRLFGDADWPDVVDAVGCGQAFRHRPAVIEAPCGIAYAGLLAGPGTAWGDVREAMRDGSLIEMASGAREAFAQTLSGPRLACSDPDLGRREGYPLILLTPEGGAMVVDAYHAETTGEYLEQLTALARREFRDGPHDRLGETQAVTLASVEGGGFGVLVDGEECPVDSATRFELAECPVDLLATRRDG